MSYVAREAVNNLFLGCVLLMFVVLAAAVERFLV